MECLVPIVDAADQNVMCHSPSTAAGTSSCRSWRWRLAHVCRKLRVPRWRLHMCVCGKPRVPRWRLHMCVLEAARPGKTAVVTVELRELRSQCLRPNWLLSSPSFTWKSPWRVGHGLGRCPHRLPMGELTLSRILSPAATTQNASRRTRASQSRDCSVVCRRATGHYARNYTVCCAGTALKQVAGRQKIVFSHLVSFRVAPPVT